MRIAASAGATAAAPPPAAHAQLLQHGGLKLMICVNIL